MIAKAVRQTDEEYLRQQRIVYRYLQCFSFAQTGRDFGISRQRVYTIVSAVLQDLIGPHWRRVWLPDYGDELRAAVRVRMMERAGRISAKKNIRKWRQVRRERWEKQGWMLFGNKNQGVGNGME